MGRGREGEGEGGRGGREQGDVRWDVVVIGVEGRKKYPSTSADVHQKLLDFRATFFGNDLVADFCQERLTDHEEGVPLLVVEGELVGHGRQGGGVGGGGEQDWTNGRRQGCGLRQMCCSSGNLDRVRANAQLFIKCCLVVTLNSSVGEGMLPTCPFKLVPVVPGRGRLVAFPPFVFPSRAAVGQGVQCLLGEPCRSVGGATEGG
jgi:hypothetical protein